MRMTKTKEFNERVLTNYKSPYEKAKEHSESLKQEREALRETKSQLKAKFDEEYKNVTEEKKQFLVTKTLYEETHKKKLDEAESKELTFKPDLTRTLASRRKRVYHHTGKWEKSKFEDEEAWSCWMNFDKDSEGCNVKIVDLDRLNVVSF